MSKRDGQEDGSVDGALKTMERLAAWLDEAMRRNVWQEIEDPIQLAMVHGMLVHLHAQMEELIELGGEEVDFTVRALHAIAERETA